MSDFIANNLHKKVDQIMDVFFGAGVASHPTIIEQINYLLFMRALSQRDDELRLLGVNGANEIVFDGELEKYHWENLLTLNAEALFVALEECFRKIPESTTNKTVRLVFRNAHVKLFDKPSLRTVLHQIDQFAKAMDESEHEGKRDVFGDTYEYLLSKLAQAGTSGQFRTPRHIIEFIVNVVKPQKGETIIDPAVGTAGFLVKAFEYLRKEYTTPETFATGGSFDKLNNAEHTFLLEHTFTGFDSDEDMIKFGMMNLYLHGLKDAKLIRQNTLTDTAGTRDKYDVVLANPPFSGKLNKDSVAEELQMNTGATEILFLRYMLRHLTDKGRIGVIVPDGIISNSSSSTYTSLRKMLIDDGLWCVVSLHSGVFKPYASVKTHVLFIDKEMRSSKDILFVNITNDGFSDGAAKRPIPGSQMSEVLNLVDRFKKGEFDVSDIAHIVSKDSLLGNKAHVLNPNLYKEVILTNHDYDVVKLKEIAEILKGKSSSTKSEPGNYPLVLTARERKTSKTYDYDADAVLVPLISSTGHGKADIKNVHIQSGKFAAANLLGVIVPDQNKVDVRYLHAYIDHIKDHIAKSKMSGSTNVSMKISDLGDVNVILPPLSLQRKIADEIDNKREAIAHAQATIAALERERAYFDPSARAAREKWPIVKLGELVEVIGGGTPSKAVSKFYDGNIRWATIRDMANRVIDDTELHITPEAVDNSSTNIIPADNVIIATRVGLGKVSIVTHDTAINQDLKSLIPKDEKTLSKQYLVNIMESLAEKIVTSGTGSTVKGVTTDFVKNIEFPLPPLETQREIAAQFAEEAQIIAANRKLIGIYEQKIAETLASI